MHLANNRAWLKLQKRGRRVLLTANMGQQESFPFRSVIDQLDKDKEKGGEEGLSTLSLEYIKMDEKAARVLADYIRQRELLQLKWIRLGGCGLTFSAFHHIAEALCTDKSSLTRLDLSTSDVPSEGNPIGNKSANSLGILMRRCPSLKHLRLANCELDCDSVVKIAENLKNNRTLKTLDLSYNHIADTGATHLGHSLTQNNSLAGLLLWKNNISSTGAEGIAAGLAVNTTLKWLGLGCNDIDDDGATAIAEALIKNIERTSLTWLGLGNNHIGDEGVQSLSDLLTAGWTSVDEDEGDEGVSCSLISLGLGGNEITDIGAVRLGQALDRNDVLKSIGLSHNLIGDEGAIALADMLRNNSTLENLTLSANDIKNEGGNTLIASLTQNTSLSSLLLAQNPVGDSVCERCAEVFTRHNISLQILDLYNTNISSKAFHKLITRLKNSDTKLQSLGGHIPHNAQEHLSIPLSGNLLEIPNLRPPPSSALPRRKLFEGVQISDRAHALMSLPTSSLTPHTVEKHNHEHPKETQTGSQVPKPAVQTPPSSSSSSGSPRFSGPIIRIGLKGEEDIDTLHIPGFQSPPSPDFKLPRRKNKGREFSKQLRHVVGEGLELQPVIITSTNEGKMDRERTKKQEMERKEEEEEEEEERGDERETAFMENTRVKFKNEIDVIKRASDRFSTSEDFTLTEETEHNDNTTSIVTVPLHNGERTLLTETRPTSINRESVLIHQELIRPVETSESHDQNGEDNLTTQDIHEYQVDIQPLIITSHGTKQNRGSLSLDDIPRSPILQSANKTRPRPPIGRRLPSVSSSSSSGSMRQQLIKLGPDLQSVMEEKKEEEEDEVREELNDYETLIDEGDERVASQTYEVSVDESFNNDQDSHVEQEKPTKEQWIKALKKRVGMMKMGTFLQTGYDGVVSSIQQYKHVTTNAKFPCNLKKNRKDAPLPPNNTRVKLQMVNEELGTDYINASFVGSPMYSRSYIITQWPLEDTIPDFWRMIWEHRVGVVIVLGSVEGEEEFWPKKGQYQFYPVVVGGEWSNDALYVSNEKVHIFPNVEGFEEVAMVIHSYEDNETERLTLLHYPHWPVNGVPQSAEALAHIFHRSLSIRFNMAVSSPMVILSPNGGGIAGSFAALSVSYELLQTQDPTSFDNDSNILDSVFRGLQSQRPGLVVGQRQFDFTHRMLEESLWGTAATTGLEETDSGSKKKGKGLFSRKKKEPKPQKPKKKPTTKQQQQTVEDRTALIF